MFGGLYMILSDRGTEFKNMLFTQVAPMLGMKQVFSFPYYPQGNGHIKNVHNLLKPCIWKHVCSELVWNQVVHIACAA